MLEAVAELAQDVVRHVVGELRAEIHAHALGADDADHLLDPLFQRGRRVVEQQMRFVEDEDQLRFVQIADFRQILEQLRQQPQQEAGIQLRLQDQLVGGEDVDQSAAIGIGPHQIVQFKRRLAEEHVGALLLQPQQRALDRADRLDTDQAIAGGNVLAFFGDQAEQGAQVFQIQQQQAAVVGQLEHDIQHAGLGVVEFQDAAQQGRAHLADRGPHRMAELAVDVPEHHRVGFVAVVRVAHQREALLDLLVHGACGGQSGHVALHVGHEHRHADPRKTFRQCHQGHGLAGAGGARDQAMAVAELRQQMHVAAGVGGDGLADQDGIHEASSEWVAKLVRESQPGILFGIRHWRG